MRPFNPDPISDRSRELFGTYMRRYEYVPSMNPFDAAISERSRELYGGYRSRYSSRKVGARAGSNIATANGVNWVDLVLTPTGCLSPTIYDTTIYRTYFYYFGSWAGTPSFRILIDDVKVYPFLSEETIVNDTTVSLGCLSMTVRAGEVCRVQFRSDNAADGAGDSMICALDYVEMHR